MAQPKENITLTNFVLNIKMKVKFYSQYKNVSKLELILLTFVIGNFTPLFPTRLDKIYLYLILISYIEAITNNHHQQLQEPLP